MSSASQTRPLPTSTPRASAPLVDKRHRLRKRRLNGSLLAASVAVIVVAAVGGYFWHRHREHEVHGALKRRAETLAEQQDWRSAAAYWQRYLWLAPDDFAARLGMIDAVEKTAVTPRDRQRLSVLLHEAFGLAPADQLAQRSNLQVRIIENQLQLGGNLNYSAAYTAAGDLLKSPPAAPGPPAASDLAARLLRVRALAGAALARDRGQIAIADAAQDLAAAAAQFPEDQRLASVAASFYRRHGEDHPEALGEAFDKDAAEARADKFIDDFVAARHNHPDALVARVAYRLQHQLPHADADLADALRQDPDHYDALLYSATIAAQRNPAAARAALDQAIKVNPADVRGYVAQAKLALRLGDLAAAEKSLRQAQSAAGAPNADLQSLLASVLIQAGKLSEADEALQQLAATIEPQLPQLSVADRRRLQDHVQLLRAKRAVAAGNQHQAIQLVTAIVAAADSVANSQSSQDLLESKVLLAELLERVGYADLAAGYWGELATLSLKPDDDRQRAARASLVAEATRRAAAAALAAGQPDRAIQWLDNYFHPPLAANGKPAWEPQPIAWVTAAKAHLQQQLALTPEQRNWPEFRESLDHAKALSPPVVDACLAEFAYLRATASEESNSQAASVLQAGEQQFPGDPVFWRAAALGYQSLGKIDDAERAMARHDELEPQVARRAELRAVVLARSGRLDDADSALAQAAGDASDPDRLELQRFRISVLLAAGAADRAFQLADECIPKSPQAPQLLAAGIEAALKANQFKAAERWEQALAGAAPFNDFPIDRFRAARLLEQFEQLSESQRDQLQKTIARLRAARPNLAATTVFAARLADLQGNRRRAIDDYQLAVAQGAADPALTERLARLLYAENRYEEADKYLARLAAADQSSPAVESLSIESALRRNDLAEATRLARAAAADHPDDPVRQILLARLLVQSQQTDEAEQVLEAACAKTPADPRAWHAMFSLLHGTKQIDKARALLPQFAAALGEDSIDMHFISAQVYEALGDPDRAVAEAAASTKLDATNVPARLLLAKLLMAVDVVRATAECEAILADKKLSLDDAARGDVRRKLAVLLTSSGKEADWVRAMRLLEAGPESGAAEAVADNQTRAALLVHKGRNRAERAKNLSAARRILEAVMQQHGAAATDVDRATLAAVYEQEAVLLDNPSLYQAAREQLQHLVNRAGAPINNKLAYTEFLLRQLARIKAAQDYAAKLDTADVDTANDDAPQDASAKDDAAKDKDNDDPLQQVFTADAERRIAELEADARDSTAPIDVLQLVSCRARLLHATGQEAQALRTIDEFADHRLAAVETEAGQARAWMALASLYSAVGQHEKAESWYRRVTEISPENYVLVARELISQGRADEAVDTYLDAASAADQETPRAAAALAQLLASGAVGAASVQRVEPVIAAALKSHADSVDLLMAVAVLNVTQDNAAQAIEYFQRVVELAPDNIMALNNLATLLAEQPSRRAEALELIQRAIEAGGRQAALLDTLGTIEMLAGQAAQAVASLEEAVAGGGGDPRYYFHLAAAYHRASRPDEARTALNRARQLGLDKTILTLGDQQLLRDLDQQLGAAAQAPPLESRRRTPGNSHSDSQSGSLGGQTAQIAA